MDEGHLRFSKRLRQLDRKHRSMAHGYATTIRPDGLIVAKPRKARARISLQPVILCLLGFFLFKGFLMAQIGDADYAERVSRLQQGTTAEQAGAWVMKHDPLSQWIADQFTSVLL